jgi:hypothetical protein
MIDVSALSPKALLALHASVGEELRGRGITRSSNNPTGDVAEYLFCRAFGWTLTANANANIDAIDAQGTRYQIKARRQTPHNNSRQLSGIRNLPGRHFDFLAGAVFTQTYEVFRAAIIPFSVVEGRATFVQHTNSHRFILHDDVWKADGVCDVTNQLRSVSY